MGTVPSSIRASFNPSSNRFLAAVSAEHKSIATAIAEKADAIREKSKEHFQKNRKTWTDREYDRLVRKQGQQPELKPRGAPPRDFSREAANNVQWRQATRMARITLAERNMTRSLVRENDRGR